MVKAIEGVFRNGKIEFLEQVPAEVQERVIVTFFLADKKIELASRGVNPEQSLDLKQRLKTFAEDWNRPEMDVYDGI